MDKEAQKKNATPRPSPPANGLGVADNTKIGRETARTYINNYLITRKPFGDDDIKSLDDLTDLHVEGEHLQNLVHGFYYWLASTPFWTRQKTHLSTKNKEAYFKSAKQVFKLKFPHHDLFQAHNKEWHEEMTTKFTKECNRSRILDTDVIEVRKSEPLYRDVSTNVTAIRAKYWGLAQVDAKTVALSMVRNAKTIMTAGALAEFNISRSAVGRGGEHAFLRWDEGTFDLNFLAPDFDWSIIKQTERQCMLFFCDLLIYVLCPFFALAVYFLFGGLRRDDVKEATKNFVFPYLHDMKRDGVAERMTRNLRSNIEHEERRKAFTSRSMRKGAMGDHRMIRDLDLIEEYARSGHNHPSMNSNAEGYIESNPAINAPGGLAAAGFTNCHMKPVPYSFDCLGLEAFETVQRLVEELWKNDVPRLKENGNLRPVLMICAARLIGSYCDLIHDVGLEHPIVKKIMEAALCAKVDDDRVKDEGMP